MPSRGGRLDPKRLDNLVAQARREAEARASTYREQALKLLPWVCGKCARSFDRSNIHQLTVHHKNHDHHSNPPDGSNWELLCVYCHDNEHQRELAAGEAATGPQDRDGETPATHRPFADLKTRIDKSK